MKNFGPKFTRRAVLAGSAALGGLAAVGTPLSVLARQAASATASRFDGLAERMRGTVIVPSDDRYDDVRKVWNGMIDRRPGAIVRCSGVADVMEAVRFAREHDIPTTIRGGGHNVAGKAVRDGALTIDLAQMHGIRVDAMAKRARAEGGVRWAAFDHETLVHNLATTGGTVGSTGVAGLTLGGGLGWLMRKHGLSCDNLVSADVVTADGQFLTARADENDDLFWALRGGGGNFGVVTSFEFRLHELEPVTGGMVLYPRDRLEDLLHFYRDYTASAPDTVTAMAGALIGPPGTAVEGEVAGWMALCHCGPAADGDKAVRPVRDFGPAVLDTIGPVGYGGMQALFSGAATPGLRNYWRSNFVKSLSDDVLDTLLARADGLPKPGSMLLIEHMGGAVARVGENETAFANRGAAYNVSVLGTWVDATDDAENVPWVRAAGDELREFATGGAYVNYMAGDEGEGNVRAAYEANFRRLVEVKRKYDPENFFSSNQNIAP